MTTRKHRGLSPEDHIFFEPERLARLRRAVFELSWLLQRRYAAGAAALLVGNRYELTERERMALMRAANTDEPRVAPLPFEALAGRTLAIDGFNLLIALETWLGGGILLRAVDGCYRDLANMRGNYRLKIETEGAITLAGELFARAGVAEAHWIFDRPVSNSGRLVTLIRTMADAHGWAMHAKTADGVDGRLKASRDVVVTADSEILNHCKAWFDPVNHLIAHAPPKPSVLDLSGFQE